MIIRHFDKNGKEHRINLGNKGKIYICSEIGNTGDYAEIRVEEHVMFNKSTNQYETSGCLAVAAASPDAYPFGVIPTSANEILIGPIKQM